MKRGLERARKQDAALFLIEITTNGGFITTMFNMSETLRDAGELRTATFVKKRALSAGSLIALSTDDIYMQPASVMGGATPISAIPMPQQPEPNSPQAPGGKPPGRTPPEKKIMGTTVTYFRQVAEFKGHSPALAGAMVDPDIEVLRVKIAGTELIITRKEYEKAYPLKDKRAEHELSVLISNDEILVKGSKDLVDWGLVRAEVATREDLLRSVGLADREVVVLEPSWSEVVGRFFSGWLVTIALVVIAVLALYVELHKPTGLGAAVFLTALVTFFWANSLAGTAGPVSIVLFLVGLVLLLVEIFFIPSFGAAGIAGIAMMLLGMLTARLPQDFFNPRIPGIRWVGVGDAVGPLVLGLAGSVVGMALLMRFFPHLPFFNRLILKTNVGPVVVTAAQGAGTASTDELLGMTGVTSTTLRPGGTARFGDKLLDVVSDGEFLDGGTPVKIVSATGNRIVVRRT